MLNPTMLPLAQEKYKLQKKEENKTFRDKLVDDNMISHQFQWVRKKTIKINAKKISSLICMEKKSKHVSVGRK